MGRMADLQFLLLLSLSLTHLAYASHAMKKTACFVNSCFCEGIHVIKLKLEHSLKCYLLGKHQ